MIRPPLNRVLFALAFAAAATPLTLPADTLVSDEQLRQANGADAQWLTHGLSYAEDRHSPLTSITPDNVEELGLAWYFDTDTRRGLEATPLVIDGVLYTTGAWSRVYAVDARTGKAIWTFDPEVPRAWGANACCDVVNRGVAAWGDRVFVGALDGRLIALDRATGAVDWEVLTIDPTRPYTITGAPRIVAGQVIIGNGGAEYGVRGYVSAYDAATGALRWRFHTVPGDPAEPFESAAMAMAALTWRGGKWWEVGGGGTVWDSMAFDPELNLLYIGVGNGAPWNRHIRSPGGGDNLFLSSIVALNATTGEYVWHYQTTPGDSWDYTATQHMILSELTIDSQQRSVLMQAPKNGFFYVLDRGTGELISAEPYSDITWASHVDPATGRPVETDVANHREDAQLTRPSPLGAHNWHPMAFDPTAGLVFIPAMRNAASYSTDPDFAYQKGSHWNTGQAPEALPDLPGPLLRGVVGRIFEGELIAWDPVGQQRRWTVRHPVGWNGGMLSTASGLVFQGTGDGRLVAYRADSGEALWSAPTQTGVVAPPVTYAIDGEQYVAVMAGWGGAVPLGFDLPNAASAGNGRLLVFRLGGRAALPPVPPPPAWEQPPPRQTDGAIERGSFLYNQRCARCHGAAAQGGGLVPDLRYLPGARHEAFQDIVRDGVLSGAGMIGFGDVLTENEVDAIHAYVLDVANAHWEAEHAPGWWRSVRAWGYDVAAEVVSWFM